MMRLTLLLLFVAVLSFSGCQKEVPPTLTFKTEGTFVYADLQVTPGSTFSVGNIAEKTKDELYLFYVEVAYDGANTGTLVQRWFIPPNERTRYVRDYTVTTRNQQGRERWIFNVNDSEGRITRKEIRVTVLQ